MVNDPITGLEPQLGGALRVLTDKEQAEIARLEAEYGCRVWRTSAGDLIPVTRLEKDHLRNIRRFLLRRLTWLGRERLAVALLLKESFGAAAWYPGDALIWEGVAPATDDLLETVAWFEVIVEEIARRRGVTSAWDLADLRAFGERCLQLAEGLAEGEAAAQVLEAWPTG